MELLALKRQVDELRAAEAEAAEAAEAAATAAVMAQEGGAEAAAALVDSVRESRQLLRGWACCATRAVVERASALRAAAALRRWQLASRAIATAAAGDGRPPKSPSAPAPPTPPLNRYQSGPIPASSSPSPPPGRADGGAAVAAAEAEAARLRVELAEAQAALRAAAAADAEEGTDLDAPVTRRRYLRASRLAELQQREIRQSLRSRACAATAAVLDKAATVAVAAALRRWHLAGIALRGGGDAPAAATAATTNAVEWAELVLAHGEELCATRRGWAVAKLQLAAAAAAEREGRLRASLLGWAALAARSCARRDAKAELLEHQAEVALLSRALATRALRVALAEGRGARFGLRATLHAWAAATRKPPPRAPSHIPDDPDRAYA